LVNPVFAMAVSQFVHVADFLKLPADIRLRLSAEGNFGFTYHGNAKSALGLFP
jgi:hypothetical protein